MLPAVLLLLLLPWLQGAYCGVLAEVAASDVEGRRRPVLVHLQQSASVAG
jgi:hypothetical protein